MFYVLYSTWQIIQILLLLSLETTTKACRNIELDLIVNFLMEYHYFCAEISFLHYRHSKKRSQKRRQCYQHRVTTKLLLLQRLHFHRLKTKETKMTLNKNID